MPRPYGSGTSCTGGLKIPQAGLRLRKIQTDRRAPHQMPRKVDLISSLPASSCGGAEYTTRPLLITCT
jgi:hypothetical protein